MRRALLASVTAALLGAAAALLVACGSSGGGGLIPASVGGPLQSDIEAVDRAAETGNGNCVATEAALSRTKHDYGELPASVDSALRDKIRLGIENLQKVASEACAQPIATTHTTSSTPKTTSTATTQTQTTTPPTTSSSTTTTTPPPAKEEQETPGAGGGTPAPGEGAHSPGEAPGGASPQEPGTPGLGNGAGGSEEAR